MTEVRCKRCGGRGRLKLTGRYAETLAALKRQRGPISGAALARIVGGVSGEAMANRLVALRRHGLAACDVAGREKLWRAV